MQAAISARKLKPSMIVMKTRIGIALLYRP